MGFIKIFFENIIKLKDYEYLNALFVKKVKRGLLSNNERFLNLTLVDPSLHPINAFIFDISISN